MSSNLDTSSKTPTQANNTDRKPVRWWIPAALLLAFVLQSLWFIKTQSLTYDEPGHIIAGLEAWQHGRFEMWTDHPPLGRYWLTLPVAASHVEIRQEALPRGYRVTAMQPGPEWLAWHTRPMNTLLGIALGLALWFAARNLFSEGAANVALALFAFTPSLIANFSVATTDGIGALFVFLAAWQLVRWRKNPSRRQTAMLGLVLGGLLLSKHYTPPEMLLALVLMLLLKPGSGWNSFRTLNWKPALIACGIALLTFWAGYLFHVSHLTVGNGEVVASFPNRETKTWATKSSVHLNLVLPAGEYIEGMRDVALSNHRGRATWFLGKIYPRGGPAFYYPVAIALKWPTVLLVLFFASLVVGVRKTCRDPNDLLLISLFGFLFLVFALQSRIAIGERHILPLYPFVMLIAGGIWEYARKYRTAAMIVALGLCLNAADALRSAPDYLAYFNFFVKPENSWRLLTDSNLDWGQGLLSLRKYEQQHPNETLHLAYFGSVDPKLYGVKAVPLQPGDVIEGQAAVGASCLSGQILDEPEAYHWLWPYQPVHVLDHSIWLFNLNDR